VTDTLILETIVVGPLSVNCYVLGCDQDRAAVVIDPGDDEEQILQIVQSNKLRLQYILLTHGHVDHIGAVHELQQASGSEVFIHPDDAFLVKVAGIQASLFDLRSPQPFVSSHFPENGRQLTFGSQIIEVITTPGHSPGSVCFKINDLLFTGDTLFCESVGRTDLLGGSSHQLAESIKTKLFKLDADTRVFPGHGPSTTIGHEKQFNPFVNGSFQ
jgi:hydroxyacylglutathione hydrolase